MPAIAAGPQGTRLPSLPAVPATSHRARVGSTDLQWCSCKNGHEWTRRPQSPLGAQPKAPPTPKQMTEWSQHPNAQKQEWIAEAEEIIMRNTEISRAESRAESSATPDTGAAGTQNDLHQAVSRFHEPRDQGVWRHELETETAGPTCTSPPSRAAASQDVLPARSRPPSEARSRLAYLFLPAQWQPVGSRSSTASGSAANAPTPSAVPCDRCGAVLAEDRLIPHARELYTELLCHRCWQRTIQGRPPSAVPTAVSEACLMDHQLYLIYTEDTGTCDKCRTPHFRGDTVFECDTCQERWTYCHECKIEADLRPSEAQRRNNAMARNAP